MQKPVTMLAAVASLAIAGPALADTVTVNTNTADGFHYGTGNDYTPANAIVSTSDAVELALRFHQTGVVAPASDAGGVYTFALGTTPISFDWSIDGNSDNALITLVNIGTGQTVSYNPFCPLGVLPCLNDNYTGVPGDPDLTQNSERLTFAFLSGLGFDPNVNDTYSATLTAGGHSVTAYAELGTGAVPEPATWAMMLLGFIGIGSVIRRKQAASHISQIA